MYTDFENHAKEGDEFLHRFALRLGEEHNKERAMRILLSVFRMLRQRLTPEVSMHLVVHLPLAIKALYVDGWKLHQEKLHLKTITQLASEVVRLDRLASKGDFNGEEEFYIAVRTMMETLADYTSQGELEDMISVMPDDLKQIMDSWMIRYI